MDSATRHQKQRAVLIAAGGTGKRFGSERPKQLLPLAGYPVLHHTLQKFERSTAVERIVVIANKEWIEEITEIANTVVRSKHLQVVAGASSRNASVECGLSVVPESCEFVLVHDGVRPLVSAELIERVALTMNSNRAVLPVVSAVDLLASIDEEIVTGFPSRTAVWNGQSPQGFRASDLRAAFAYAREACLPDYPTLYELLLAWDPTIIIKAIPGEASNLKITLPLDKIIAGQLLLADNV